MIRSDHLKSKTRTILTSPSSSPGSSTNPYYAGFMPEEEIAKIIAVSVGPSGANKDYLFQLELFMDKIGVKDEHLSSLADKVRCILKENQEEKL